MWRASSLEKTLMLGKIKGRRRRGWQRMRWLDGIIDSMGMSLSKHREMIKDREAWRAASMGSQRVGYDWTIEEQYYCYKQAHVASGYLFRIAQTSSFQLSIINAWHGLPSTDRLKLRIRGFLTAKNLFSGQSTGSCYLPLNPIKINCRLKSYVAVVTLIQSLEKRGLL